MDFLAPMPTEADLEKELFEDVAEPAQVLPAKRPNWARLICAS